MYKIVNYKTVILLFFLPKDSPILACLIAMHPFFFFHWPGMI